MDKNIANTLVKDVNDLYKVSDIKNYRVVGHELPDNRSVCCTGISSTVRDLETFPIYEVL